MKKIVGIIVLVVLIIVISSRVYYLNVINHVYQAIENFRNENNRYYSATTTDENIIKEEIMKKDNVVKWNEQKDGIDMYCQWKNWNTMQKYLIQLQSRKFREKDLLINEFDVLNNLPKLIYWMYKENELDIKEFLKVKYILPTKYNDEKCYKIVTNTETLIVNHDTYLPVFYSSKITNSTEDSKNIIETIYEFKVGEVTDEDIQLPDLTGYTKTE